MIMKISIIIDYLAVITDAAYSFCIVKFSFFTVRFKYWLFLETVNNTFELVVADGFAVKLLVMECLIYARKPQKHTSHKYGSPSTPSFFRKNMFSR